MQSAKSILSKWSNALLRFLSNWEDCSFFRVNFSYPRYGFISTIWTFKQMAWNFYISIVIFYLNVVTFYAKWCKFKECMYIDYRLSVSWFVHINRNWCVSNNLNLVQFNLFFILALFTFTRIQPSEKSFLLCSFICSDTMQNLGFIESCFLLSFFQVSFIAIFFWEIYRGSRLKSSPWVRAGSATITINSPSVFAFCCLFHPPLSVSSNGLLLGCILYGSVW